MARYQIEGSVVDTENATAVWDEDTKWNGSNHISVPTGSQWEHETLFRSRRGRFYLVHSSDFQGRLPHAELVSPQEAARWLLLNDNELPEELAPLAEEVSE